MIYTFWEGPMPAYIRLCLNTWRMPYTMLNYSNVSIPEQLKTYTLPQIADYVRVHVLRDNGGYWLDADTIILGELPSENITGDTITRTNSIGLLHTEKGSEMFREWADYQESVLGQAGTWDLFGNAFTDEYVRTHTEITIHPIDDYQPERAIEGPSRRYKYERFYFENKYHLDYIRTDLLMLHNSWTPSWYKWLTEDEVLKRDCTMSNVLREII